MDSKDIITLLVAVLIVSGIALFVNPPQDPAENTTFIIPIQNPADNTTPIIPIQTQIIQENSGMTTEKSRISYNPNLDDIYARGDGGYPLYLLPENFDLLYWGSDVIGTDRWKEDDWIELAYLHETHGGLTQVFSVPYGIWRINTSMKAEITPQYAILRWALVDRDSGVVYQGSEIRHKGNSTRIIQNLETNPDLYLIIASQNVDEFRLVFETLNTLYNPDTSIEIQPVRK